MKSSVFYALLSGLINIMGGSAHAIIASILLCLLSFYPSLKCHVPKQLLNINKTI